MRQRRSQNARHFQSLLLGDPALDLDLRVSERDRGGFTALLFALVIQCTATRAFYTHAAAPVELVLGEVQSVQAVDPEELAYFPATQFVHAVDPTVPENLPATQFVHAVRPVDVPKVPAGQEEQAEEAAWEYFPVAQETQTLDADAPVEPDAVPLAQEVHKLDAVETW